MSVIMKRLSMAAMLGMAVGCNPASKPPSPARPAAQAPSQPVSDAESVPPPRGEQRTGDNAPESIEAVPLNDASLAEADEDRQQNDADAAVQEEHVNTDIPRLAKKELAYLNGVALIPREVLFGNPDKASARISPDGHRLAWLAPDEGVLNVWVSPIDDLAAAKPVTHDRNRGIRVFHWAFTNEHIIYLQDVGGDEDWHVYRVDLATRETTDLTPLEKVNAQITGMSNRLPNEILIGLNDRDPQVHDIHRLRLDSGERELLEKNTENFVGYVVDDDLKIRFAMRMTRDGGNELLRRDEDGEWKTFAKVPMEDTLTTQPVGFDKSGDTLFFIDSRGRNTGALTAWNLKSGKQDVLAENDRADIGEVLSHPTENTIDAVSFSYLRKEWQPLADNIRKDLEYLQTVDDGELTIASQSIDNQHWIVAYLSDSGPTKYYHYDRGPDYHRQYRGRHKATFLFNDRDDLVGRPLVKMHPTVIKARDKLELVCYLTLPPGTDDDGDGRPSQPVPMVLNVHGGPWGRDAWGFNGLHQWLANRGYAVLSVNFRGSTGLGKDFVNAGDRQWAGKMHDDLIDAVNWAIDQKIANRDRVAIMGGSYGGYATLVGLTFTPDVFACGVDIVGPSNILTLLSTIPPYWQPMVQMFKDRVGDFSSREGKEFLRERSPLTHVDRIQRPLLIGQGANDPRVKQAESDQIVNLMKQKRIPVTYVLYPDEGHGFARPENRLSFNAVAEAFLAEHLGGRYEPIGDAFRGASITVPSGADQVPGLADALRKKP